MRDSDLTGPTSGVRTDTTFILRIFDKDLNNVDAFS
jgi:hypothetical protein